jgi:predicted MFS family arabinose efflux permease
MAYSLIGEFYPLEKRGRAIGWIVASTTLAYVIGAPVIGIIASIGSWRSVMIWLALPLALASLILAFIVIPNKSNINSQLVKEPFFAGCKQAFSNTSAIAILFVTMFSMAEGSIGFYAISFFRSQFAVSITVGSIIIVIGNILAAVGGVVAGLLVNRVGRKPLGTVTCLAAALLTLSFTFVPNFPLSCGLSVLRFWFSGMSFTAGGSLVIEQLPKFRATMMSLNTAFMNLGMLLASIAGGIALDIYNYQTLALILGGLGVVGTVVWVSLVRDPCKAQKELP